MPGKNKQNQDSFDLFFAGDSVDLIMRLTHSTYVTSISDYVCAWIVYPMSIVASYRLQMAQINWGRTNEDVYQQYIMYQKLMLVFKTKSRILVDFSRYVTGDISRYVTGPLEQPKVEICN